MPILTRQTAVRRRNYHDQTVLAIVDHDRKCFGTKMPTSCLIVSAATGSRASTSLGPGLAVENVSRQFHNRRETLQSAVGYYLPPPDEPAPPWPVVMLPPASVLLPLLPALLPAVRGLVTLPGVDPLLVRLRTGAEVVSDAPVVLLVPLPVLLLAPPDARDGPEAFEPGLATPAVPRPFVSLFVPLPKFEDGGVGAADVDWASAPIAIVPSAAMITPRST
jgi:hypothetical protein